MSTPIATHSAQVSVQRELIETAGDLFAPTIYPFISLQNGLLRWQTGEQIPEVLDDTLAVSPEGFITEDAYTEIVDRIQDYYLLDGIQQLFKLTPSLESSLSDNYDDDFVTELSKAATGHRSTDVFNVKEDIFSLVQPSQKEPLGFDIPAHLSKEGRGLNHLLTARFLIPRQYLDVYEENPAQVISRFQDEADDDHCLVAEEWPTFLYDEQAGWNESDRRRGLFKGHLLVRVALRIFRNKTAARLDLVDKPYNPKTKAKGPKDLLTRRKLTRVTPRMIAYAAVQTYIGLSSMDNWGVMDGTFSLIHFYHLIVKTLTSETDEWVANTLGWWKRKLFGDSTAVSGNPAKRMIRITKTSAYRLTQRPPQEGSGVGENPSNYTHPIWTQRSQAPPPSTPSNFAAAPASGSGGIGEMVPSHQQIDNADGDCTAGRSHSATHQEGSEPAPTQPPNTHPDDSSSGQPPTTPTEDPPHILPPGTHLMDSDTAPAPPATQDNNPAPPPGSHPEDPQPPSTPSTAHQNKPINPPPSQVQTRGQKRSHPEGNGEGSNQDEDNEEEAPKAPTVATAKKKRNPGTVKKRKRGGGQGSHHGKQGGKNSQI